MYFFATFLATTFLATVFLAAIFFATIFFAASFSHNTHLSTSNTFFVAATFPDWYIISH
jgi:hypothetical protein